MLPDQETEITLSNGRLLGLFFGLVVLCGVFLVMGYMLGKNSAPGNTLLTDAPAATPTDAQIKPAAIQSVPVPVPAPSAPVSQAPAPEGTDAPETAAEEPASEPAPAPKSKQEPAPKPVTTVPAAANYIVQVAAISNQQDADRLAAALRRKQYAVFVTSRTPDNLFHVQVGPFHDAKQAEAARSRLAADGYNAFVKR